MFACVLCCMMTCLWWWQDKMLTSLSSGFLSFSVEHHHHHPPPTLRFGQKNPPSAGGRWSKWGQQFQLQPVGGAVTQMNCRSRKGCVSFGEMTLASWMFFFSAVNEFGYRGATSMNVPGLWSTKTGTSWASPRCQTDGTWLLLLLCSRCFNGRSCVTSNRHVSRGATVS